MSSTIETITKCNNPICLIEPEVKEVKEEVIIPEIKIGHTQTNGTLVNNIFKGGSSSYLTLNKKLELDQATSWEFKTKYTYKSSFGHATIFAGSSLMDFTHPRLVFDGDNQALKFYLSSTGTSWNINSSDSSLIPNNGTTYFIKAGFNGKEYYIDYNTEGWDKEFIRIFSVENDKKVFCNDTTMLMNCGINTSKYYSSGTIDLNETNFTVHSSSIFTL